MPRRRRYSDLRSRKIVLRRDVRFVKDALLFTNEAVWRFKLWARKCLASRLLRFASGRLRLRLWKQRAWRRQGHRNFLSLLVGQ